MSVRLESRDRAALTLLSRRYRSILIAAYPADWRARNEDAVLGTLMDQAEASGRSRPRAGELLALAFHGLGVRWRTSAGPFGTNLRDRLGTLALALGTVLSVVILALNEWRPGAPDGPWNEWSMDYQAGFGPFASVAVVLFALWIVAFAFAAIGMRWVSRAVLWSTVPLTVVITQVIDGPETWLRPPAYALAFLALLALVGSLGRPRRLLLVTVVTVAGYAAVLVLDSRNEHWHFTSLVAGWSANGLSGSAVWFPITSYWPEGVLLVTSLVLIVRGRLGWLAAVAVFSAVVAAAPVLQDLAIGHGDLFFWLVLHALLLGIGAAVIARFRGYRLRLVRES